MAFDYAPIAADALKLITEFGREVTLVERSETPVDPLKPWDESTATHKRSLAVMACFVPPQTIEELGINANGEDFIRRFSEIAIVASQEKLSEFDQLVDDDGATSIIEYISSLRPGPMILLHYFGVKI